MEHWDSVLYVPLSQLESSFRQHKSILNALKKKEEVLLRTTVEMILMWILFEIQRSGYLSSETVFIDSTHIKSNANIDKKVKKAFPPLQRLTASI